jgi:hypothetical protein
MILSCDLCATSWDSDDPNQDRRCKHSDELERRTAPKLPDGFQPGCSNWRCMCWEPGAVCEEFMGDSSYRHCPRCGWTRELHKPKATTPPGDDFEKKLKELLNTHGVDVYCSTADYILAAYLTGILEGLRKISLDRLARQISRELGTN